MNLFRRRRNTSPGGAGPSEGDVARLTAKADLVVEELELVINQMADLLRKKFPPHE